MRCGSDPVGSEPCSRQCRLHHREPQRRRNRPIWCACVAEAAAVAIVFGDLAVHRRGPVGSLSTSCLRPRRPCSSVSATQLGRDLPTRARCDVGARGYGFAIAFVLGSVIGGCVASSRYPRRGGLDDHRPADHAVDRLVPAAIVLFKLSETAIMFVVVLGAAPSIANGLINGIDNIPPVLLRAGPRPRRDRLSAFRHVVLPAAMPSFVGGLKQGWAFAWRSLHAGELIVVLGASVGFLLQQYRNLADAAGLIVMMIVILVIGIVVDAVLFGSLDRVVRRRHGLLAD